MARPLRPSFPGALYHVTSRGNNRGGIYSCDDDRRHFLRILQSAVDRYHWLCYAYCLMDNHYHLLIETPLTNISLGMRHLNGLFTTYVNRTYRRVGHLFQARFKGILVEKQSHLLELARYIVLNPVRAGICASPEEYPWSSYRATLGRSPRPSFLRSDLLLEQFHMDRSVAIAAYERFVQEGFDHHPWDNLKAQIYLGSDDFVGNVKNQQEGTREVPKIQREPLRPPLSDILKNENGLITAYRDYGYRLQEIAAFYKVHYTTISRWMQGLESDPKSQRRRRLGHSREHQGPGLSIKQM